MMMRMVGSAQCGSVNVHLEGDTEDPLVVLICGDHFPSIVSLHSVYSTQQIPIIYRLIIETHTFTCR